MSYRWSALAVVEGDPRAVVLTGRSASIKSSRASRSRSSEAVLGMSAMIYVRMKARSMADREARVAWCREQTAVKTG